VVRRAWNVALIVLALAAVRPAAAGENAVPFSARSGVEIATDAARTWAADARLVYLENDEALGPDGTATRWGYLFYSHSRGKARGYSVKNGALEEAADLGFDFDAPPVADAWIDSGEALAIAAKKAGTKYCIENGGRLATMLLVRGAFHDDKPNATTWAVVYAAPGVPSLFVVVDADNRDVVRTWRG
jgi:hypothetical protein